MSNIKQLKQRYFEKNLSIDISSNKQDLINKIVDYLTTLLPNDMLNIVQFDISINSTIPSVSISNILNSYIYTSYYTLETDDELNYRLVQDKVSNERKLEQLNKLAVELDYKLEKVNE